MPQALVAATLNVYEPAPTAPEGVRPAVGKVPTKAPLTFNKDAVGAGPLAGGSQKTPIKLPLRPDRSLGQSPGNRAPGDAAVGRHPDVVAAEPAEGGKHHIRIGGMHGQTRDLAVR